MSADSDGAGYPIRPLVDALDQDLERKTVREWLSTRDRDALRRPESDPEAALAVLGRLIRSGDLSRSARQRMDEWWRAAGESPERGRTLVTSLEKTALSLASSARTLLSSSPSSSTVYSLVDARDRAETALVALGHAALCDVAGASESERKIAAELRAVDDEAAAREHELADAMSGAAEREDDPWILRLVRLDDGPWWCDLLVVRGLRKSPGARRAAERKVLRFKRSQIASSLSMSMGSYDAGNLQALLEKPLATTLALLFDGAVEVYAVTLPRPGHENIAGLLLREKRGGAAHIESVKLAPPGPIAPSRSNVDLAWWVPLAGTADANRDLVVSYRAEGARAPEEERLRLELEG